MENILFLSNEGKTVSFEKKYIKYTQLLEMLYRRSQGCVPIKTNICEHDLKLTAVICYSGMYPCIHQTYIKPEEFGSFQELCDYMGIDAEEDNENEYMNDFLCFLGQEEVPDEPVDIYEGWTEDELNELRKRDAKNEEETQSEEETQNDEF